MSSLEWHSKTPSIQISTSWRFQRRIREAGSLSAALEYSGKGWLLPVYLSFSTASLEEFHPQTRRCSTLIHDAPGNALVLPTKLPTDKLTFVKFELEKTARGSDLFAVLVQCVKTYVDTSWKSQRCRNISYVWFSIHSSLSTKMSMTAVSLDVLSLFSTFCDQQHGIRSGKESWDNQLDVCKSCRFFKKFKCCKTHI